VPKNKAILRIDGVVEVAARGEDPSLSSETGRYDLPRDSLGSDQPVERRSGRASLLGALRKAGPVVSQVPGR
jgi:hypothetical protein